jgi:cytoskeletal protein RodZ
MSTGRARYSTVGLAVFFLATLALYILVRPPPGTPHPDAPASNTAAPTSTTTSTAPTSHTERPSASAPPGSSTSPALTPPETSGASDSPGIATERPVPGQPGQRP